MKLGLGTVQFGLDYGISNTSGKTPAAEVVQMLALAERSGVRCLDTAPAYAESEEVVGRSLPRPHHFEIVTKTVKGEIAVRASLERSLARLQQPSIDTLLVHDGDALSSTSGPDLFEALLAVKREGLVRKIGTIVYTAAQIDAVIGRFALDVIQLPINLLDQRLLQSGHLDRLKARGIEVHARSVFLQGLLLMPPAAVGPHFDSVRSHLARLAQEVARQRRTMLEAALTFVVNLPQIDRVVVGACSTRELAEIIAASGAPPVDGTRDMAWADERILNPALWPRP